MQEIYSEFGVFRHKTISASFDGEQGMNIMAGIMKDLRENTPSKVGGLEVVKISDHLKKETLNVKDGTVSKIDLPAADVFCMYLENDCSLIIRPSGTEPKIKAYMTACAPTLEKADEIVACLEKEANIIFGK
jgi:phosphoglucomutase